MRWTEEPYISQWWSAPPASIFAPEHTYVFFAQHGECGPIKIGFSRNPWAIVHEMSTCTPEAIRLVGVVRAIPRLKNHLLEKYHHIRVRGTWHTATSNLCDEINELIRLGGV